MRYDADPDGLGPPGRGDGAPTDESSGLPEPPAHVVAGDCLPPPPVPGRSGLPGVPGEAFPRDGDHGRLLAHLPRSPPRDGSRVSCDDLVARSAASRLLPDVSVPSADLLRALTNKFPPRPPYVLSHRTQLFSLHKKPFNRKNP